MDVACDRLLTDARLPGNQDPRVVLRDAPGLVPGTTMPAMPLTEREAADVAAYLYAIGR